MPQPPNYTGQKSQLLPRLIEHLVQNSDRALTLLDFGPANPHTIQFLNQFRCKIYFLDIEPELSLLTGMKEDGEWPQVKEVAAEISRQFSFQPGLSFDLCFFWDYLNLMDSFLLRALSIVLQPHVTAKTAGYGFAAMNRKTVIQRQVYGIGSEGQLLVYEGASNLPLKSPHTQAVLEANLPDFKVKRSVLHNNGRLECLFNLR